MKKFCPLLVEFITVDGDKDMKNLCLNWLNIAFNVCLDKAFGSTAQQGRLLRWLINLITLDAFIKPSQEIDADYSLFSQRPHNLSMCECSELMQTIYDNFLQSSLAEETFGKPVEKSNDNNTMWITDAFLWLNFFFIASYVISNWLHKSLASSDLEVTFTENESETAEESFDFVPSDTKVAEQEARQGKEAPENEKGKLKSDAVVAEYLEDVSMFVNFNDEETQEFLDLESSTEAEQTPEDKIEPNPASDDSSTSKPSCTAQQIVNKRSKNFVNINIKNVEQKTKVMAKSQMLQLNNSPSGEKPMKAQSLIPVRKVHPTN